MAGGRRGDTTPTWCKDAYLAILRVVDEVRFLAPATKSWRIMRTKDKIIIGVGVAFLIWTLAGRVGALKEVKLEVKSVKSEELSEPVEKEKTDDVVIRVSGVDSTTYIEDFDSSPDSADWNIMSNIASMRIGHGSALDLPPDCDETAIKTDDDWTIDFWVQGHGEWEHVVVCKSIEGPGLYINGERR